jgi:anti-anti-sigma regulatory factor
LLQLEGRVFFVNAELIAEKIRPLIARANPKVVALDLGGVNDLEYTALKMLSEAEKRSRERGMFLWLVGLQPQSWQRFSALNSAKRWVAIGMFFNLEQVVAKYQSSPTHDDAR